MISLLVVLFVFSFIGFLINKFIFDSKSLFNIPLGFVFILAFLQLISSPFLFFHGSYKVIFYIFIFSIVLFLIIFLMKFWKEYIYSIFGKINKRIYLIYLFSVSIVSIVVILLTISEIDQFLYSAQIISTLKTGIIYFADGSKTILHEPIQLHQYESYSLLNTIIIDFFNYDHISYIFRYSRIVDIFVILGTLATVNQFYFKNKISTFLLLMCGILGLNILSSTPFSVDEYVLLFSGTTGTLFMFCMMAPLILLYFKCNKYENLFFVLILLFSFSITYTFIPVMILVALIISIIKKDGKLFYLATVITSLNLIMYFPDFYIIFILCALLCCVFYYNNFLSKNVFLLYLIYALVIVSCVIYGGINHFGGINGNLQYYLVFPLIYLYYKSKSYDRKILLFSILFLIFNIVFSEQEFRVMIVNTRSSIFLMTSFMIVAVLNDYKFIRLITVIASIFYVIFYSMIGIPNEYTRNFTEYFQDLEKYGSFRSMLIANKDQEKIIEHPFEVNSDILFYNFTGPNRMDKFDDSIIQSLNKYVGITNIYVNEKEDYCSQTSDCYIIISKFYYDKENKIRKLMVDEYIMETEKYFFVKKNSIDNVNQYLSKIEELYEK